MPQLRLIGLVLFITTVFLAMAATATQTTHLRFKRPSRDANGNLIRESPLIGQDQAALPGEVPSPEILPPGTGVVSNELEPTPLQFVAVPVVYPLLISGAIGLMLWFVPATPVPTRTKLKRRRRR